MSAGPIWGADPPASASAPARPAGWGAAEQEWEQAAERALERAAAGDWPAAEALWRRALEAARANFPPDDPRLAAGWANVAAAPFFRGARPDAAALAAARRAWARSPGWIDRMRLEQTARSSVHHMRLEAKHRRVYQAAARRRLQDLAAEARTATARLAAGAGVELRPPERWRAEKPPVFGDTRRILSACLLLAFRAPGPGAAADRPPRCSRSAEA